MSVAEVCLSVKRDLVMRHRKPYHTAKETYHKEKETYTSTTRVKRDLGIR